jgi:GntR family transcriptional regulator
MVVAATRRAGQSESQRLALLEQQLVAVARHAGELELPAEAVLNRLGRLMRSRG